MEGTDANPLSPRIATAKQSLRGSVSDWVSPHTHTHNAILFFVKEDYYILFALSFICIRHPLSGILYLLFS